MCWVCSSPKESACVPKIREALWVYHQPLLQFFFPTASTRPVLQFSSYMPEMKTSRLAWKYSRRFQGFTLTLRNTLFLFPQNDICGAWESDDEDVYTQRQFQKKIITWTKQKITRNLTSTERTYNFTFENNYCVLTKI